VGGLFFRPFPDHAFMKKTGYRHVLKKSGYFDRARVFRVTIKFEFAINHSIQFIATPQ
jgi:hypothetical protein